MPQDNQKDENAIDEAGPFAVDVLPTGQQPPLDAGRAGEEENDDEAEENGEHGCFISILAMSCKPKPQVRPLRAPLPEQACLLFGEG